MKHSVIIIILTLFLSSCKTQNKEIISKPDISKFSTNLGFSMQGESYYYTLDKKQLLLVEGGHDLNISPDGSYLAYTEDYKNEKPNAAASNRQIAILNLNTGSKNIINFPSEQCYGPVWNNDGSLLAFNAFINSKWNIVLSNKEKVIKTLRPEIDCNSISWTADSKGIITHRLDSLFIIDTSNIIRLKMGIKEIINSESISSDITFTMTNDNRYLIFNASNNNASLCNKNEYHDELPYAIFKYEFQNKKLTKLTPNDLFCGDYTVVGDLIYFTGSQKCTERQRNIYTMTLTGQNIKEFLRNANSITVPKKNGT